MKRIENKTANIAMPLLKFLESGKLLHGSSRVGRNSTTPKV